MRRSIIVVTLICAGCATYVTPGGSVRLHEIDLAPAPEQRSEHGATRLPASLALVRVQAPQYRSNSTMGQGAGRFSVVPGQELMSRDRLQTLMA